MYTNICFFRVNRGFPCAECNVLLDAQPVVRLYIVLSKSR